MVTIQQALGNLFQSLDHLETVAAGQAASLKLARQRELFNGSKSESIDPSLLASKLDAAILKVESMLREG